LFQYNFVW
jgi:hypothetical protein